MHDVSISVTGLNLASGITPAKFVSAVKTPSGADTAEHSESFDRIYSKVESRHESTGGITHKDSDQVKTEKSASKPARASDRDPPDSPPGTEVESRNGQPEEEPVTDASTGTGTRPVQAKGGDSEASVTRDAASKGTVPDEIPQNTLPVIEANLVTRAILNRVVSTVLTSDTVIVSTDVMTEAAGPAVTVDAATSAVTSAMLADALTSAETAVDAAPLPPGEVHADLPTIDPGLFLKPETIVTTPDTPIPETDVSARAQMPIPFELVESVEDSIPRYLIRQNQPVVIPESVLSQSTVKADPVRELQPLAVEADPAVRIPGHTRGSEWTEILEFTRLLDPTVERLRPFQPERTDNPAWSRTEQVEWSPRPKPEAPTPVDSFSRDSSGTSQRREAPVAQAANPERFNPVLTRLTANPLTYSTPEQVSRTFWRPQLNLNVQALPTGTAVQTAPGTQAARPAGAPSSPVQLTQEMLVSDVRQAVIRLAADGRSEARIVLHPPELGELVVRLESSRNGVVRIEFHTFSPLVREALEAGLSRLTEALKSEGLTLAQAEVHLNLQLGTEGRSGESESGNADSTHFNADQEDALSSGNPDGAHEEVERLPEGATISIYA